MDLALTSLQRLICHKTQNKHLFTHDQTVLFLTIQFCISHLFVLGLFDPKIEEPNQILPLWNRVDLEVMAVKGYFAYVLVPRN